MEEKEDFPVPTDLIIEAIENHENYIQLNGTATGAKNSCSYSDLALEIVDKEIYRAQLTIFKEKLAYARFRDDCFLVWLVDKDLLSRFVYFVNILDPSLKFTVEFGGMSIEFMDLLIKSKIASSQPRFTANPLMDIFTFTMTPATQRTRSWQLNKDFD